MNRWLIWLWMSIVALGLFVALHQRAYDDPYITYRYAHNLAHGTGFVYNLDEHVLSTTTPLYTLLLALVDVVGLPIPLISNLIGCICLALGGGVLWWLGQAWHSPLVGTTALLLYPTFSLLTTTLGSEMALYVTLILGGVLAYVHERYGWAAVLLACAALTRADGVLAAGVLAIHFLIVRRSRLPVRAIGVYLVILALWYGWAWWRFGSPLPATLSAKQQQGGMIISRSFVAGAWQQLRAYAANHWYSVHAALLVAGLLWLVRVRSGWWLLLAWNLVYFAAYTVLGVSGYFWYYAPLIVGVVVLIGLGAEALAAAGRRLHIPRRWLVSGTTVLVLMMFAAQARSIYNQSQHNDARYAIYRNVGEWLQINTPADASVGALEIGIIGYYAQRRMIDFAGLIQPAVARQLTRDATYEDAALWAVEHYQPTYLVLQAGAFGRLEPIIAAQCRLEHTFTDVLYPTALNVYHCAAPVHIETR